MRVRYNPNCSCAHCRAHGFMGPAVLITLGVLFLLDQVGHYGWMDFGSTWPALLIVIGLMMFLQHNASPAGHVPREYRGMPPPPVQPGYMPPQNPVVTPPPATPSGSLGPGSPIIQPDDREAHNG
jgi:LiaI-LiaF-like transmembrane region